MAAAPHTIIITGASNGIGAALAKHYAKPGNTLGLIGRDATRLQHIADTCQAQGAQVQLGLLDITDTPALQTWLMQFDQQYPVDLVIANAGITGHIGLNNQGESAESIQRIFAVNLHGAINTVQPFIPLMRERKQGQIALISSLAAFRGMPITPAYSASKAAIKSYGEALRGWLAPEGVRVNVICPGFVQSDMSDSFPSRRPFMIQADKAARLIAHGLERNHAIISFPFPINWSMWLMSVTPFAWASFFYGLTGYNRAHIKPIRE